MRKPKTLMLIHCTAYERTSREWQHNRRMEPSATAPSSCVHRGHAVVEMTVPARERGHAWP